MSEAEEAEIETIRQHRQELLEDIKVRTILFLLFCLAFSKLSSPRSVFA